MKHTPLLLVILDGYGYREEKEGNAIAHAHKPNIDKWFANYPHTLINASGTSVGLLPNMMGNSEVGHMTIGSGRVIQQPVSIIDKTIEDKSLFANKILIDTLATLPKQKKLHLIGLLSDAGVHSDIKQLFAFIDIAHNVGIEQIVVHPFLDGRDTPPQSAATYLAQLDKKLSHIGHGIIGSIQGRYYAMDRDNHWERTEETYCTLTQEQKIEYSSWHNALDAYYTQEITDEFIPPTQLTHKGIIENGDGILFFNIRPDRARQLTQAFCDPHFNAFSVKPLTLSFFITAVNYGIQPQPTILYDSKPITHTLKEVLSNNGYSMFSIAETEKYAHVTYFFSGGREEPWPHEEQVLIPSIPAKNYINHPCMSAKEITDKVLQSLKTNPCDFYLINYANPDMVGHSGDFGATVKAVECVDQELKRLYDIVIEQMNGAMILVGDHGNAEEMIDVKTGTPKTSHTSNPVPFIVINKNLKGAEMALPLHSLADIAPFILANRHLPIPEEMKRS